MNVFYRAMVYYIFMRWKIEYSIQREVKVKRTFHLSPNGNICTISPWKTFIDWPLIIHIHRPVLSMFLKYTAVLRVSKSAFESLNFQIFSIKIACFACAIKD